MIKLFVLTLILHSILQNLLKTCFKHALRFRGGESNLRNKLSNEYSLWIKHNNQHLCNSCILSNFNKSSYKETYRKSFKYSIFQNIQRTLFPGSFVLQEKNILFTKGTYNNKVLRIDFYSLFFSSCHINKPIK